MINSRPLTYLSDKNLEAITPFHLLHGRNIVRGDRVTHRYHNYLAKIIENRINYYSQSLLAQYWNRFCYEYVYALREMMYDREKRAEANVVVGDVVMLIEERVKSVHWKKGRIIEVISGRYDTWCKIATNVICWKISYDITTIIKGHSPRNCASRWQK